jgi:hypothetical protein
MEADGSNLLAQLLDIHSAGQPGWWPPAPGWWVLAFVLLLVLVLMLRRLAGWLAVRRRRKAWLHALEELNRDHDPLHHPHQYLAGLNRLFRAVAVKAFPDTACARLQGEEWVSFIAALMPGQDGGDHLGVLASGPYEPLPRVEATTLNESARTWVSLYG